MADLRVGEKIVFLLFHVFQVPYIPASKAQVNNVMNLLKGRKGGLVDLGSGDGRIVSINRVIFNYYSCSSIFFFYFFFFTAVTLTPKVLEAHRQGFSPAVGYELNPWLICLSRLHAWRLGHHEKVSYCREDLWKV